jgi:ribonucleoside-diphosphate reductase alpha subunit
MRVVKRSGDDEAVSFNKVLQRIRKASKGLTINPDVLAQQVLSQIYDGVKTSEIDELTGQLAASLSTNHPDWGTLAANIVTSNHQKKTSDKFSEVMLELSRQPKGSYIHPDLVALCADPGTAERIDREIDYQRDYLFDYFGFKTLEKSYLLRDAKRIIRERPQHVWMRVALALWKTNLARAFETYHALSMKKFTHATPTLFNSGTPRQQLSSCFLLTMKDDSIMGIYETLKDCAAISQHAGGIGLSIHKIRAKGSIIRGTNGTSNGIVPMLRNFNATARYVDQCFTPDTLVRVADATNIPICDVKEGGDILTSLGYRKVLKNVIHEYNGHVVQLKMDTGAVVRVTDTHPVLSVKSHGNDMDQLRKAIAAKVLIPEFTDIKELEVGDYLIDFPNWNRIAEITSEPYTGQVHDFEIEAPHDYYVNGFGFAHNGGGKRNGSFAIYLEPWHADIEDFLKLKLNTGMEEDRARDLFYALWIPDLFMKRVEANVDWTVFCPDEAPGLDDVWGDAFEALYTKYEAEGRGRKKINAQKLWFQILDAQIETGTPYLLYKDAANAKSNQQNLGTIKSSNLCCEVVQYSAPDETAVCNLASISLPSCVVTLGGAAQFDFAELRKIVRIAVRNLNRVIDINYYPTPETEKSNMRHRPVGLGIQGLADVFALMKYDWESPEAARLNQLIFEYMYFEAVSESARIAQSEGSYASFAGSPASQGRLQPDLWNVTPITEKEGTLDWAELRLLVQAGMRNSLLVAPMPTASTSQILGNNECFEPFTTNIYSRRTLAGEFTVLNKYLLAELRETGLWSEGLKNEIIARNGSVQGIDVIPADVQARYKTTWEIKQRILIDMARDRGAFIDQSQSLNLFVADPTYSKLTSMHFYAWKAGLKTGCYYLRSKAPVVAQQFTVDPRLLSAISSGGKVADISSDSEDDESDQEDSSPAAAAPAPVAQQPLTKAEERRLLLERLSAEYEAEEAKGCTMCSS